MRERVPGVSDVEAKPTEDGRLVLRFQDGSFKDPFIAHHVSDGTIKMFAYLVLLYDPNPHPLLAVEEPENQLYPALIRQLVEEFRAYAQRGGQVFVSTHSPDFLNGAELNEIRWLVKEDGFTTVRRASESELLQSLPPLIDRLQQMLSSSERADIAVGYFFVSGFQAAADQLPPLQKVRILVGRTDRRVLEEVAPGLQQTRGWRLNYERTTQFAAASGRGWRCRPSKTSPGVYRSCRKQKTRR